MKKLWPILALAVVLACQAVFPTPTATPQPTQTEAPPEPTRTDRPTREAPIVEARATDTPTAIPPAYIKVRLKPRDGEFGELIINESRKAAAMGLLPVIEYDASW